MQTVVQAVLGHPVAPLAMLMAIPGIEWAAAGFTARRDQKRRERAELDKR